MMFRFLKFTQQGASLHLAANGSCISDSELQNVLEEIKNNTRVSSLTINGGYDWWEDGNRCNYPAAHFTGDNVVTILESIPENVTTLCFSDHPAIYDKLSILTRLPSSISFLKFSIVDANETVSFAVIDQVVKYCPNHVKSVKFNNGFSLYFKNLGFIKEKNEGTVKQDYIVFPKLLNVNFESGVIHLPAYRAINSIKFDFQLKGIYKKYVKFIKNYPVESEIAGGLYLKLLNARNQFIQDGKLTVFKNTCLRAIEEAGPGLEHHRGWKQRLANFASAILSIISFGIINKCTHRGLYGLFPTKTDTTLRLETMAKSLDFKSLPVDERCSLII